MTTRTAAAPGARDASPETDAELDEFEREFTDGPPAMGVAILLAVFMAGMFIGGALACLR